MMALRTPSEGRLEKFGQHAKLSQTSPVNVVDPVTGEATIKFSGAFETKLVADDDILGRLNDSGFSEPSVLSGPLSDMTGLHGTVSGGAGGAQLRRDVDTPHECDALTPASSMTDPQTPSTPQEGATALGCGYHSPPYSGPPAPVDPPKPRVTEPAPKPRKKRDRFNGMSEDDVLKKTLPDHLAPNLDIVIIGINPGLTAAYVGHHYAGPGNHFWKCLYMAGLIPEPMNAYDDYRMLEYGIGFTNMVPRATKGSGDINRREIKEGGEILTDKVQKFRPKIAVFNGKGIYEIFCGHKNFYIGKQPEPFPGTDTIVFVMPSSSARCSQLPRAVDKVPFYVALKKIRDYVRGLIPAIDESEVVFPDLELKVEPRRDRLDNEEKKGRKRKKDEAAFCAQPGFPGNLGHPGQHGMFPGQQMRQPHMWWGQGHHGHMGQMVQHHPQINGYGQFGQQGFPQHGVAMVKTEPEFPGNGQQAYAHGHGLVELHRNPHFESAQHQLATTDGAARYNQGNGHMFMQQQHQWHQQQHQQQLQQQHAQLAQAHTGPSEQIVKQEPDTWSPHDPSPWEQATGSRSSDTCKSGLEVADVLTAKELMLPSGGDLDDASTLKDLLTQNDVKDTDSVTSACVDEFGLHVSSEQLTALEVAGVSSWSAPRSQTLCSPETGYGMNVCGTYSQQPAADGHWSQQALYDQQQQPQQHYSAQFAHCGSQYQHPHWQQQQQQHQFYSSAPGGGTYQHQFVSHSQADTSTELKLQSVKSSL